MYIEFNKVIYFTRYVMAKETRWVIIVKLNMLN